MKILIGTYFGEREQLALAANALRRLGHEVTDYAVLENATFAASKRDDFADHMAAHVERVDADAVLFWSFQLTAAQLTALRERVARRRLFALFNWDDPYAWYVPENDVARKARHLDVVLTTCEETCDWYRRHGAGRAVFCAPGFDPSVHKHTPLPDLSGGGGAVAAAATAVDAPAADSAIVEKWRPERCDASLVCTNLYDDAHAQRFERRRLVDALTTADAAGVLRFRLYGPAALAAAGGRNAAYAPCYGGFVQYADTAAVFSNSRVNYSTHVVGTHHKYLNERVVTITGSGGLLVVDDVPGMDELFAPNVECLVLDAADPVAQARRVVDQPERHAAIAAAGQRRALACYTWDHWAANVERELQRAMNDGPAARRA